jgi:hypothetical protein
MSAAILACHAAGRQHIVVKHINGARRRFLDVVPHDRDAAVARYAIVNGKLPARVIKREK